MQKPAVGHKGGNALKDTRGDKIFFAINAIFLGLLALIILYPLYFIVIASFSDPDAVLGGQVVLAPVNITFEGYEKVFQRQDIWTGYLNTIIYTLITVVLSLLVTIPAGWALSRKTTPGKKFWMIYFIIPMFFGGGLIPFYNVMSSLKLHLELVFLIIILLQFYFRIVCTSNGNGCIIVIVDSIQYNLDCLTSL